MERNYAMALVIVRVLRKSDGGMNRKVMGPERYGDGQQVQAALEKLLREYPEHGWNEKDGPWARDADGQLYTFDVNEAP
jgi:hypothetical protein